MAGDGGDMTVQLWNATSGEHLRTLSGHTEKVSSVAFSPDGKTLASASWDETVRLWNTETGEHLRTLSGHTGLVDSIAFSPDGSTIASNSGYRDETVRLWDVNTGQNLWTRAGHSPGVTFVAFSADGSTLVSGGSDGIRRWDAATGQLLSKSLEYGGTLVIAYNVKNNMVAIGDIPGKRGAVGCHNGPIPEGIPRAQNAHHYPSVQPRRREACQRERRWDIAIMGYGNRRTKARVHRAYGWNYRSGVQRGQQDDCQCE